MVEWKYNLMQYISVILVSSTLSDSIEEEVRHVYHIIT